MGSSPEPLRVVVVGGGLAGCMAAIAAHAQSQKAGPRLEVVLMEKMKLGGNSARASSGVNALTPSSGDCATLFEEDTRKSGGRKAKEELVHALVANSEGALAQLRELGVNLTRITQLGGHSVARTHSPVGGNVGWSIMSNIFKRMKALSELKQQPLRIMEGTMLEDIIMANGRVAGVRFIRAASPDREEVLPAQAVILATGGFSASRALLKEHNPTAAMLPTTNGPWATGECLDIAQRAGARLVDMDQVQIHPTGFIDPNDPEAETKFLAPEKLRGLGAILLNTSGKRFVDELSTRDRVSDAIMRQEGKWAWLLVPSSAAVEFGQEAIDFYHRRNLMVKVDSVAVLAALLSVDQHALVDELELYNEVVLGQEQDPFGKTSFPPDVFFGGEMYAAEVTPVVHYTMGGIEIDASGRAMTAEGGVVEGLYAAGEASGGVHGANRLGGNSLLECVVFGNITGTAAVQGARGAAAQGEGSGGS